MKLKEQLEQAEAARHKADADWRKADADWYNADAKIARIKDLIAQGEQT